MSLESLEKRLLLSITLDNGLQTNDPDYFAVVLDGGGGSRESSLAGVDTLFEYFPYLVADGQVFNLWEEGSDPVLEGGKAVSTATLSLDEGSIDVRVESWIPEGSQSLVSQFQFTASGGADLTKAIFWEYLDSAILGVSDDILTASGSADVGNLVLTTIDPVTGIEQAQSIGETMVNASATGWAADMYADLQNNIETGTFDADPSGTVDTSDLPPGIFAGYGDGWGPEDVTSAIEFGFTDSSTATVTAILNVQPKPSMENSAWQEFADPLVSDLGGALISLQVYDLDLDDRPDIVVTESDSVHFLPGSKPERTFQWYGESYHGDDDNPDVDPRDRIGHPDVVPDGTVSFFESYTQPRVGGPSVVGQFWVSSGGSTDENMDVVSVIEGGIVLLENRDMPDAEYNEPYATYDVTYSPRHNLYISEVLDLTSSLTGDPHQIEAVATADFNDDTKPDLVLVTSTEDDEKVIYIQGDNADGNNDGSRFGVPTYLDTDGGGLSDVVAVDYNGDGFLDILALDFDNNKILVYDGDGKGGFTRNGSIALNNPGTISDGPVAMLATDLDNDGDPDLVVANEFGEQSGRHVVLLYNMAGTYSVPLPININTDNKHDIPKSLAYGDFDEDGNDDIVVGNAVRGEVIFLMGTGTADTSVVNSNSAALAFTEGPTLSVGENVPIQDIAVLTGLEWRQTEDSDGNPAEPRPSGVDINADGHADLIVLSPSKVYSFLNLGFEPSSGDTEPFVRLQEPGEDSYYGFTEGITVQQPGWTLPFDNASVVAEGDLNGDGWQDLIVNNVDDDRIGVYLTSGPQSYYAPVYYDGLDGTITGLAAGDFHKEGEGETAVDEVVVVYGTLDSLLVLENDGNGLLTPGGTFFLNDPNGSPLVADFNQDGLPDLATLAQGNRVTVLLNDSAAGVSFDDANPRQTILTHGSAVDISLAHFTDDTYPDLLVGHASAGPTVLQNDFGNGGIFVQRLPILATMSPRIAAGDFDDDGFDDVAFYDSSVSVVWVYVQDGFGGFVPAANSFIPVAGDLRDLAAPDMDRDGVDDLLILRRKLKQYPDDPDRVVLLSMLSSRDGTFGAPVEFAVGLPSESFLVGDLNADLYPDAITLGTRATYGDDAGIGVTYIHSAENIQIDWSDWATTTKGPFHVVTGDLDGDGDNEVVVGNEAGQSFSVYENSSNTLSTPVDYSGPRLPVTGIGLGDVDGDDDLDVIVHYAGSDLIGIYLNEGNGTFGEPDAPPAAFVRSNSLPDPTGRIEVADLNGDGYADFAIADASGDVVIFANNHNLTFNALAPITIGASIVDLAFADANTDGVLDLIVARDAANNGEDGIWIMTGNGNMTFNNPVDPPVGSDNIYPPPTVLPVVDPVDFALGDTNGDGFTDVVALSGLESMLNVFLWNDAEGGFNKLTDPDALPFDAQPLGVGLADLNEDDVLDVVVLTENETFPVYVMIGVGDGRFAAPSGYRASNSATDFVLADIDNDANETPDLVLVGGTGPALLEGTGEDGFTDAVQFSAGRIVDPAATVDLYYYTQYDPNPVHLAGPFPVGDNEDTFIWNSGNPRIRTIAGPAVLVNDGTGVFNPPIQYNATQSAPYHVAMGDLDNDGDADVIVANESGRLTIYMTVNGQLLEGLDFVSPLGHFPVGITLADINNDNLLDVVARYSGRTDIGVYYGDGAGNVTTAQLFETGVTPNGEIRIADFDNDGLLDLVFPVSSRGVGVLLQDGSVPFVTQFNPALTMSFDAPVKSVAVGDLDGDATPDLAVATNDPNLSADTLAVFTGTWFADLLAPLTTPEPTEFIVRDPIWVEIGDMDNDGNADVVSMSGTGTEDNFSILEGDGAGGLGIVAPTPNTSLNEGPIMFRLADLDGDGLLDIVALTVDPREPVNLISNEGSFAFAETRTQTMSNSPASLAVGDMTGDGLPEVVATGTYSTFATLAHQDYLYEGGNEVYFRIIIDEGDGQEAYDDVLTTTRIGDGAFWNGVGSDLQLDAGINPYSLVQQDMNGDGGIDLVTMAEDGSVFNIFYGMSHYASWMGWTGPLFYDAPDSDWSEFVPYYIYDVDELDQYLPYDGYDSYMVMDSGARVFMRNDIEGLYYDLGTITMGSSPTARYPVYMGLNIDMPDLITTNPEIANWGDHDFFRFTMDGSIGANDALDITWDYSEGALEAFYRVADADIWMPINPSANGHLTLDLSDLTSGTTYDLVVKGEGLLLPGVYEPSIQVVSDYSISFTPWGPVSSGADDAYEPNDIRATAATLPVTDGPNEFTRLNMKADGNDWYVFSLDHMPQPDEGIRIDFNHLVGDLDLTVYQYDGNDITWSRAQFTNQDSEFVSLLGAQPGKPVYIQVTGDVNTQGYTLNVNLPGVRPDRFEDNDLVPFNPAGLSNSFLLPEMDTLAGKATYLGPIAGNFDLTGLSLTPGDTDWFHFYTQQPMLLNGMDYEITVYYDDRGGDLILDIYDEDGGRMIPPGYNYDFPPLGNFVYYKTTGYDPVRGQSYITLDLNPYDPFLGFYDMLPERGEHFLYVFGADGSTYASDYTIEFKMEPNHAANFDADDLDPEFSQDSWFIDLFAARPTETEPERHTFVNTIWVDSLNVPDEGPVPLPSHGAFEYQANFPPILPDHYFLNGTQTGDWDTTDPGPDGNGKVSQHDWYPFRAEWYPPATDIVVAEGAPSQAGETSQVLFLWGNQQREFWGHNPKNDLTDQLEPVYPVGHPLAGTPIPKAEDGTDDTTIGTWLYADTTGLIVNLTTYHPSPIFPEEMDIEWYPDRTPPPPSDISLARYVQIYDLNEDGLLDIVVANSNENRIDVLWGNTVAGSEGGNWTSPGFYANPRRSTTDGNINAHIRAAYHQIVEDPRGEQGIQEPVQFWLGDVNEYLVPGTYDGVEDIVVAAPGSQEVWVIEGQVDAALVWSDETQKSYQVGFEPTAVTVVELDTWMFGQDVAGVRYSPTDPYSPQDATSPNEDGDMLSGDEPEIIVVDRLNGYISVLRGHGEHANPTWDDGWVQTVGQRPQDLVYGDFNMDLIPDVAVVNGYYGNSSVSVLFGNRNESDARPYGEYTVDWNTTVSIPRDPTIDWYDTQGAWQDPTNDWGTLQYDRSWQIGHFDEAVQIEGADWNGDGVVDLAVLDRYSGLLTVGFNDYRNPAVELDKELWGWIWNPWFPAPVQQYDVPNELAALDTLEIKWRIYDPATEWYGTRGLFSSQQIYWDLDNDPSNGFGGIIDGVVYSGLIQNMPMGTAWSSYNYWAWQAPFYLAGQDVWIANVYTSEFGGWDFDYLNPEAPVSVRADVPTIRIDDPLPATVTVGEDVDILFEYLIPADADVNINLYYDFDLDPWNEGEAFLGDDILYADGNSYTENPLANGPRLIATNNQDLANSLDGVGFLDLAQAQLDKFESVQYTYRWMVPDEFWPDLLTELNPNLTVDQIDEIAGKSLWFYAVINDKGADGYDENGMPLVGPEDFSEISRHWRSDYSGSPVQVYPDAKFLNNIAGMTGASSTDGNLEPFIRLQDMPSDVLRLTTRDNEFTEYRIGAQQPIKLKWWDAAPSIANTTTTVSLFYDEYPNRNFSDGVNWIVQGLPADATPGGLSPYTPDSPGIFQWDVPVDLIEQVFYIGAYVEVTDKTTGDVISSNYDYMQFPSRVTAPWRWSGPEVSGFVAAHSESWVVSTDFDGDGHLDLAATSAVQGDLAIYGGTGDGNFTLDNGQVFNLGAAGYSLVIGDFWSPDVDENGNWIPDGKPDVVASIGPVANGTITEPSLLVFGNVSAPGNISFLDPYNVALFPEGMQPITTLLPDPPEGITVLPATYLESTDTWETGDFKAGSYDFNRDGYTDLVALDYTSFDTNPGAPDAFQYTPGVPVMIIRYGDPAQPGRFLEVDPENDELIPSDTEYTWKRVNPDTGALVPVLTVVPYAGRMASIMDANDDAWPDVAVLMDEGKAESGRPGVVITDSLGSETVQFFLNNRTGELQRFFPLPGGNQLSHPRWPGSFLDMFMDSKDTNSHILAIQDGDFNGDGITDFAVASHEMNRLRTPQLDWYVLSVYLGQDDGRFGQAISIPSESLNRWQFTDWHFTEADPSYIAAGDFDNDGHQDIVVLCHDDDSAVFYKGIGDGTFEDGISYDAGKFPTSAAVGDFNEDGWLDLTVSNQADRGLSPLLNTNRQYTPVIILDEPSYLFVPQGAPLEINWRDADDDSDAVITLYWDYDDDRTNGATQIATQNTIFESIDGVEIADSYTWKVQNPAFFPGLHIYLHARITDGVDTTWNTLKTPLTIIDPNEAFIALKRFDPLQVPYNNGITIQWFDNDNDDADQIEFYVNNVPVNNGTEVPILSGGTTIPEDPDTASDDTLLWTNQANSFNGGNPVPNNVTPEDYLNGGPVYIGAHIYNGGEDMWSWIADPITIIALPEIENFVLQDEIPGLPGTQVGYPSIQMSVNAIDNDTDYTVTFFWDDNNDPGFVNAIQSFDYDISGDGAVPYDLTTPGAWPSFQFDWNDLPTLQDMIGEQVYFGARIQSGGVTETIYAPDPVAILALEPIVDLTAPDPLDVTAVPSGDVLNIAWTDAYYAYYGSPSTNVNVNLYWEDAANPGPLTLITPTPIVESHTADQVFYDGSYGWTVSSVAPTINIWAQVYDPTTPANEAWDTVGSFTVTFAPEVEDVALSPTTVYPGEDFAISFDYRDRDGDLPFFNAWWDPAYTGQLSGQAVPIATGVQLPVAVDWASYDFTWTTPDTVDGPEDGIVYVRIYTADNLDDSAVSGTGTIQDDPTVALDAALATTLNPGQSYQITWNYEDNDSADQVNFYYSYTGVFDGSETAINDTPIVVPAGAQNAAYAWSVPGDAGDPEAVDIASHDQLYILVEIIDPAAPQGNANGRDTDASAAVTIYDPPVVSGLQAGPEAILGQSFPISFDVADIDTYTPALYWDVDNDPNNGFGDPVSGASGFIRTYTPQDASGSFSVNWVVNVPSNVVGSNIYIVAYAEDNNSNGMQYSSAVYVDDIPTIQMTDFGAGFQWVAGDDLTVSWTAGDLDANALIDLAWDTNTDPADNTPETEGTSWGTIVTGLAEDSVSSYNWTVPIELFSYDLYLLGTISDTNGQVAAHSAYDYTENTIEILKGNVPTLIAQQVVDRLLISIYDIGVDSANQSKIGIAWNKDEFNKYTTDVLIVGSGKNDRVIKSIEFYNNPENIGIVIEGTGQVGKVDDKRGDLLRPIGFIASEAQVKKVTIKSGVVGYDINAMTLGDDWNMRYDIDGDGDALDLVGLYLAAPTETSTVKIMGNLGADLATETHLKSLQLANITEDADIMVRGDLASMKAGDILGDTDLRSKGGLITSVKFNTWQSGLIQAGDLKKVASSGLIGADISVLSGYQSALSLKAGGTMSGNITHNLDVKDITVKAGDFTGDLMAYSVSKLSVSKGSVRNSLMSVETLFKNISVGVDIVNSDIAAGELGSISVKGLLRSDTTNAVTAERGTFTASDAQHDKTTVGAEPQIWNGVTLQGGPEN